MDHTERTRRAAQHAPDAVVIFTAARAVWNPGVATTPVPFAYIPDAATAEIVSPSAAE